jgi:hypothetical protein
MKKKIKKQQYTKKSQLATLSPQELQKVRKESERLQKEFVEQPAKGNNDGKA